MNTKKQLTLAWSVAAILGIALLVALYVISNQSRDLGLIIGNGSEDIAAQREKVAADCSGTDAESKIRCQEDLQELSDLLRKFGRELKRIDTTPAQ